MDLTLFFTLLTRLVRHCFRGDRKLVFLMKEGGLTIFIPVFPQASPPGIFFEEGKQKRETKTLSGEEVRGEIDRVAAFAVADQEKSVLLIPWISKESIWQIISGLEERGVTVVPEKNNNYPNRFWYRDGSATLYVRLKSVAQDSQDATPQAEIALSAVVEESSVEAIASGGETPHEAQALGAEVVGEVSGETAIQETVPSPAPFSVESSVEETAPILEEVGPAEVVAATEGSVIDAGFGPAEVVSLEQQMPEIHPAVMAAVAGNGQGINLAASFDLGGLLGPADDGKHKRHGWKKSGQDNHPAAKDGKRAQLKPPTNGRRGR